ncbi:MAG TPA: PQQ-binding-like beta-propeller repeat protein [Vicinamibacterales bacterium]|nr:PQQ-binding-like beta-propeller repeat protein [Vicinamibacterales bacterium]
MIRTLLKVAAAAAGVLLIAAGALFAFGARVVLDGGGGLHVRFVKPADEQAEEIARHREAQRAQAPPPVLEAPPASSPLPGSTPLPDLPPSTPLPPSLTPSLVGWPEFRGPARDGHYRGRIRTGWPASGLTPMWKQPVGGGYASFVTARGRAFTIEQRGSQEVAAAYDIATGRELWTSRWDAAFKEMMGGDGPRATPTWDAGRVYVLGATGELRALDEASGRLLWRVNILQDNGASNLQWGMAAAPLIVDDTVVVLPGGSGGRSVVAYDKATGARVWSALDDMAAYSSPMLVTIAGVRQILVFTASRLAGLTPDGGAVLWEYPWKTSYDVNASQPLLLGGNRLFLSTGYGTGSAVIELARTGDGFTVREVWRNIAMKNQFTSSVLLDGFIYGLDEAILACIDAATGERKWKGGRYGYGQLMLADGHLIVLTEGGDMALVRATPEAHQELARFPLFDGKTWNHPVISDGILLVRNITEMAAFDLRPR